MNEKGVKHNLGRGDKHFSKAYIDDLFVGKRITKCRSLSMGYLDLFWYSRSLWLGSKNGAVQNHIKSNLINKYGFK